MSFLEATSVFEDPLARIFDDPAHSTEEHREIVVGHSAKGAEKHDYEKHSENQI